MAIILSIETSSKNCSVSIAKDAEQLCLCEEISEDFKHSESLHVFIKWAIEGAKIDIDDIDAISVGKGPGSYTGLRIGVASAKGFCFGLEKPLISINSLEILSFSFFNSKYNNKKYDYIIPIMDAHRMEIYTAIYNDKGKIIEETNAHILNEKSFDKYKNDKILFVGDAIDKTEKYLKEINYNLKNAEFIKAYPSAKNMIELSELKYQNKEFENIAYFEPFYLKEWK